MNPFELQKERVLVFGDSNQADQAYSLLRGLNNLQIKRGPLPNNLLIRYSVQHYSLEGLKKALTREGFHFQHGWLDRLKHTLIHYCEDVQYHNLKTPEPRTKNNTHEVFLQTSAHSQSGLNDDTPEARESK